MRAKLVKEILSGESMKLCRLLLIVFNSLNVSQEEPLTLQNHRKLCKNSFVTIRVETRYDPDRRVTSVHEVRKENIY